MIRIAIVEDDQSADDQLTACLEKLSLQSKEVFDLSHYPDAEQFLFAFHSQFDLIFMDIEMPNMDGLSAARRMREIDSNVALVFVTNLARYAINGYEVSALDYILKPLDYDAFYLKMQKVLRYCQTQQQRRQQSVVIPAADGNIHLPLSELLYVEVLSHTLIYHTLSHDYETYGTLKNLEKKFTPPRWMAICKSRGASRRFTRITCSTPSTSPTRQGTPTPTRQMSTTNCATR